MTETKTDLVLFKRKYWWQYALLAAAVVYLFVLDPLRSWWTFETRTVEITEVRALCAAFEGDHAIPVEVDSCERLRTKMAGKPGVTVAPRTFVTFRYRSPADDSTRTASVVRDLDDAGQPIAVGSRLTVALSRKEPAVFRVP